MNRVLQLALALTVASVARVVTVAAQSARFGLGGGLIAPLSTYKDDDKAGWLAGANVEFAIPLSPVGVRVDGLYGETKHRDIGGSPVDGKTRLIGGLASVVWNIPASAPIVKRGTDAQTITIPNTALMAMPILVAAGKNPEIVCVNNAIAVAAATNSRTEYPRCTST